MGLTNYLIDDIFFLISTVIASLYIFKVNKGVDKKTKFANCVMIFILNSSYNSHFTVINDNNFTILRTAIWSYKLIYKFSFMDITCFLYICFNFLWIFKILRKNKIMKKLLIADLSIYVLSFISLLLSKSYAQDNFSHFIIFSKSLLYSLSFMCFFFKNIRKKIDIIFPIIIIMIFSFFSMSLYDPSLVKNRYNISVLLSDQEDITTILYFLTLFFANYLIVFIANKKKIYVNKRSLKVFFSGIFVFLLCFLTLSKGMILFVILDILYLFFLYRKKLRKTIISLSFAMIIFLVLFSEKIISLITSDAIYTRLYQIIDFQKYIKNVFPMALLMGIGIGGAFFSRGLGDSGEIKGADILKYGTNWKFEIQTPFLSVLKDSGICGLFIFLINRFDILHIISKKCIRDCKINDTSYNNIEKITTYLYIATILFTQYAFHSSVGPISIFIIFLLNRISLKEKYEKKEMRIMDDYKC